MALGKGQGGAKNILLQPSLTHRSSTLTVSTKDVAISVPPARPPAIVRPRTYTRPRTAGSVLATVISATTGTPPLSRAFPVKPTLPLPPFQASLLLTWCPTGRVKLVVLDCRPSRGLEGLVGKKTVPLRGSAALLGPEWQGRRVWLAASMSFLLMETVSRVQQRLFLMSGPQLVCAVRDRTVTLMAALPAHCVHSRTRQPPPLVPHHQQTAYLESARSLAGAWHLQASHAPTTALPRALYAVWQGSTCRGVLGVCRRR